MVRGGGSQALRVLGFTVFFGVFALGIQGEASHSHSFSCLALVIFLGSDEAGASPFFFLWGFRKPPIYGFAYGFALNPKP